MAIPRQKTPEREHSWHVGAYMLHMFNLKRWPITTAYNRIKRVSIRGKN